MQDSCIWVLKEKVNGTDFSTYSLGRRKVLMKEKLCKLPMNPGQCEEKLPRWFFNTKSGHCEKFQYGGCLGNSNNFVEQVDCEKICK